MGDKSHIQWTDATWGPTIGCTRVSPGCDNCYFFRDHDRRHLAWKRGSWPEAPQQYHLPASRMQLLENRLDQPSRWTRPRRIFVDSQSDLFHDDVPFEFIEHVWARMWLNPQHIFQILTKRPARMIEFLDYQRAKMEAAYGNHPLYDVLPNVWLGVSAEDQERADERTPLLLRCKAAVYFVSFEPLLGPIYLGRSGAIALSRSDYLPGEPVNLSDDFPPLEARGLIDWMIVGGESGPRARPMQAQWARALRDQSVQAGIPFFFKQWGEFNVDGQRVGRKSAGRELDGREWNEYPPDPPPLDFEELTHHAV